MPGQRKKPSIVGGSDDLPRELAIQPLQIQLAASPERKAASVAGLNVPDRDNIIHFGRMTPEH
jgi:hypothetical protein